MVCSAFHSTKAVVSQVSALQTRLAGLWGLTVKAQCLSTCLPPRHPNTLWLSYRPRLVGTNFSQTNESGAERVAILQPLHLSQISGKIEKVCPFSILCCAGCHVPILILAITWSTSALRVALSAGGAGMEERKCSVTTGCLLPSPAVHCRTWSLGCWQWHPLM